MGGEGLDAKVRELTIISLACCFSLGLAWAYEADFFAMFFAAAAAIAGVEAVRRSLSAYYLKLSRVFSHLYFFIPPYPQARPQTRVGSGCRSARHQVHWPALH
jgi:hypothetical protein